MGEDVEDVSIVGRYCNIQSTDGSVVYDEAFILKLDSIGVYFRIGSSESKDINFMPHNNLSNIESVQEEEDGGEEEVVDAAS